MRRTVLVLCLLASPAFATDGDQCDASLVFPNTPNEWTCDKLCSNKDSGAITCGPLHVRNQDAVNNLFIVQTTGGCAYDDIMVGGLATSTTSGVAPKVYVDIDDDLVATTGTTGVSGMYWPFPVMPWIYVSSGTLATCSTATFDIWFLQKAK